MKRRYNDWIATERRLRLYLDRIENAAGEGQPDVHSRAKFCEYWIELKVVKQPKRHTTRLLGNQGLNPNQINWHLVHAQCSLKSFILIRDDNNLLYLVKGSHAKEINEYSLQQMACYLVSWETVFAEISRRY